MFKRLVLIGFVFAELLFTGVADAKVCLLGEENCEGLGNFALDDGNCDETVYKSCEDPRTGATYCLKQGQALYKDEDCCATLGYKECPEAENQVGYGNSCIGGKTHKTYVAIVQGEPKNPEAIINLPIARNLKHPTTFMVDPKGKPSETYYKVLETKNGKSMLELKPVTGRTHQLRVHLKYIGCPIIGDPIYNPDSKGTRLFLHARSLEITIPNTSKKDTSGERRMFEAKIPATFNKELQNNVF